MTARETDAAAVECLTAAGLAAKDVRDWLQVGAGRDHRLSRRSQEILRLLAEITRLLGRLPQKARRNAGGAGRSRRRPGPRARGPGALSSPRMRDAVYDALTVRRSRFVRVEELVTRAAGVVPGLVPTAQEIAAEDGCPATRQGWPRDRPGPVSVRGARQRALRTPPLPRHAAAAAGGRGVAAAARARRARWSSTARRCTASARLQW